jgi:hypothetical protein
MHLQTPSKNVNRSVVRDGVLSSSGLFAIRRSPSAPPFKAAEIAKAVPRVDDERKSRNGSELRGGRGLFAAERSDKKTVQVFPEERDKSLKGQRPARRQRVLSGDQFLVGAAV